MREPSLVICRHFRSRSLSVSVTFGSRDMVQLINAKIINICNFYFLVIFVLLITKTGDDVSPPYSTPLTPLLFSSLRSLILCHSKTSDDFPEPEERRRSCWTGGDAVPGPAGPWGPPPRAGGGVVPVLPGGQGGGPGWATDPPHGLTVKGQQQSSAGMENPKHLYPHSEDLREHKRGLRRTFSIKVRRYYFFAVCRRYPLPVCSLLL